MAKHSSYNPFAPLNAKQQRNQARQYVNAQIQPIIRQINAQAQRQSQGQSAAIYAASNALAQQLMPQQQTTHNIYAGAQANQRALDDALYAHLAPQGGNILANQVGVAPERSQALAGISQGAAAAGYAQGSSGLAQLIAQGANAENYASQLPGFARSSGAWRAGNLANQIEQNREKDVSAIQAKIPGLVAQTGQDIANRELQKAIAQQSGLVNQQKFNLDVKKTNAQIQHNQNMETLSSRRNDIAWQRVVDNEAHAKALERLAQQRVNIAREKALQGKAGKKNFTPGQIQRMKAVGLEQTKLYKNGAPATTYSDGTTIRTPKKPPHQEDRYGAIMNLFNHGIPLSLARWIVGRVYGPIRGPQNPGGGGQIKR